MQVQLKQDNLTTEIHVAPRGLCLERVHEGHNSILFEPLDFGVYQLSIRPDLRVYQLCLNIFKGFVLFFCKKVKSPLLKRLFKQQL